MEAVLASLTRLLGADWIALVRGEGRIEVRDRGATVRRGPAVAPRAVDPDWLARLEAGRATVVGPEALRRWPRISGSGLRTIAAYAARERPGDRLIAGWKTPIELDARRFEEHARWAFAVDEAREPELPSDPALVTACATHDLRHLLTVALLEIERARLGGARDRMDVGADEALARVQRTLEEARALCETSRAAHEPRPLRPILESIARDAEIGSGRRGRVEVRVRCPANLALRVDRGPLERALRNLVSNAIEATPDGGAVELEAAPESAGEIDVSVRDEGRGIARADLRALLRAGRSGSGGSGLGTASVRDAVRSLGGRLLVRSRPRAGTEFVMRLPRSPDAGARAPA